MPVYEARAQVQVSIVVKSAPDPNRRDHLDAQPGLPVEVVAEHVHASVAVSNKHYDVAEPLHEMLRRRVPHLNNLSLDPEPTDS